MLDFFAADGLGINVTLPHKQAAADLVNELTPRAQLANAVNTIVRDDRTLIGDNTDGTGLVIDLKINLGLELVAAAHPAARCRRRGARRASARCSSSSRACS